MSICHRVLLVEDSVQDAIFNVLALERGGLDLEFERVETASQMKAALEQKTWDVILCDYHLPGFDGVAALEIYNDGGLDIPFIVVSGQIGEEQAVAMIKAGAHEYVMKDNLGALPGAVIRELQAAQERCIRRRTRAAEEYLAAIIQDCENAVFGETLEGTILSWNAGAERLYGYRPSEIIGLSTSVLVPQHRPPQQVSIREQIKQGGQAPSFETMHVCKYGTRIAVSVAMSPIKDGRGRVVGVSTIVEDLTRRRQEEDQRLALIQDLTAALGQSLDQEHNTPSVGADVEAVRC